MGPQKKRRTGGKGTFTLIARSFQVDISVWRKIRVAKPLNALRLINVMEIFEVRVMGFIMFKDCRYYRQGEFK